MIRPTKPSSPVTRRSPAFILTRTALIVLLCPITSHGLPSLTSCEGASPGDQWRFCTGSTPITLRGSNYIRLDPIKLYHSTFDAGQYNRTQYRAAMAAMARDGFNIARVFLDELPTRGIGGPPTATAALDPGYLDRLAQFVSDAEEHGIYTMLTVVYVPDNAYFRNLSNTLPPVGPEWNGSPNQRFLTAHGHAMYKAYLGELGAALAARLSASAQQAVLFSLQNEFALMGNAYPFATRHGTVTLADGVSYDMANATDRQQAADANTNLWAETLRAAVRTHLPQTFVTVGVFTFNAVQKSGANGLLLDGCNGNKSNTDPAESAPYVDCRFPARPVWLSRTSLDFLDVHIYQKDGSIAALDANLVTEEWDNVAKDKPIMMGEFGCNDNWYPNGVACAPAVRELQLSSCSRGFVSWLFWTYDCDEQPDWHTMVDDGGAINHVLSPVTNPDPCKAL